MRCASALSTSRSGATAVREVLDRAGEALAGEPADLAVAFVSPHHAGNLDELAARVRERGFARHLLGCTGESIVGEDREIEGAAAISLWALRAPGVALTPLRPTADESALDQFGIKATCGQRPRWELVRARHAHVFEQRSRHLQDTF